VGVSVQEQTKEVCTPPKSVGVGVGRFGPWGNETGCQVVGVAMDKTQRIEVYLACTLVGLDVGVEGVAGAMKRASWWSCCGRLQIGGLPDFEYVHWMSAHCPWDRTQRSHAPLLQAFDGINCRHGVEKWGCRQFVGASLNQGCCGIVFS